MLKEYLKLLARRESKVVLGNRWANLWLLTIVLVATFVSIAFSNGSMIYLSEKMNDPFTNWVNIENAYGADRFDEFRANLADDSIQSHYGFCDVQGDNYYAYTFTGKNGGAHYFECRFFERLNSDLVRAILSDDEDNVIGESAMPIEKIRDESLGLIITRDVLHKLGYSEDSIPAYINYSAYSEGADTLGIKLVDGKYAEAPMPLLGVVRRLPMNMDIIASHYWYEQYNNRTHPFGLNKEEYVRDLFYFVPDECPEFVEETIKALAPTGLQRVAAYEATEGVEFLRSWKSGRIMRIYAGDATTPTPLLIDFDKRILEHFAQAGVVRLYNYRVSDAPYPNRRFLSVNFTTLDSIRAFENYAKSNFNVQIEMSQVSSKENFNAVSVMANILSWAMIVFSVVCIIMFIVNMLQSYFQKVKRNLGTFKAFGIGSAELINVYILILLAIVVSAIVISLSITWLIQLLLPALGMLKDGQFNYLALWNMKTVWSIIIVIVATLVTVRVVMGRLLRQTPGDLIYDR